MSDDTGVLLNKLSLRRFGNEWVLCSLRFWHVSGKIGRATVGQQVDKAVHFNKYLYFNIYKVLIPPVRASY